MRHSTHIITSNLLCTLIFLVFQKRPYFKPRGRLLQIAKTNYNNAKATFANAEQSKKHVCLQQKNDSK